MRSWRAGLQRTWRSGLPLFLILLFLTLPATIVQAVALCVNPSGINGCFVTIQSAVNAAASGDTIMVGAGNYDEAVTINQSLTLIGAGIGVTTLDHRSQVDGCACITVNSGTVAISGFTAIRGTTGAAIRNYGQTTVTDSLLTGNSGGIGNGAGGTLTVINSTLSGNIDGVVNRGGGILVVTTSIIEQNTGAGVYNENGSTLTIVNSTISSNNSGGVTNFGTLSIVGSTIVGNQAPVGGGIQNWGPLNILNSTIVNNTAPPGTPFLAQEGPGIANNAGNVTLTHVTMAGNRADGFSAREALYVAGGQIAITASILSNAVDCSASAAILSGDYNVTLTNSCFLSSGAGAHDIVADPRFVAFGDNGGPTQTVSIGVSSPAFDRQPPGGAGCPGTDQRGVARPQGAGCDSGAYEVVPPAPAPAPPSRGSVGGGPPPRPAPMPRAAPTPPPPPNPLPPHR